MQPDPAMNEEQAISIEQVLLVKKTWRIFRAIDPAIVGDTFYSKLFSENPSLRRLFPRNMHAQYYKLMEMLNTIIGKLDRANELEAELSVMATRQAEYGIQPAHYKWVGDALLWTLKQGLGKDWTPNISQAWTDVYVLVAETMLAAVSPVAKTK